MPIDLFASGADVIVEVLGGREPARTLVAAALERGVPVVTANKTLLAHDGEALRALARTSGTPFAYEASVLAGVPFIGSLSRRPLASRAVRIEGIVNGTSHYVLSAIANGASFARALGDAVERGFAEPDSSADVGGRDAAEKLAILLHLAGRRDVSVDNLPRIAIDVVEPADFEGASRLGGTIKPVAIASVDAGGVDAWVGPAFVDRVHPFAALEGVANAVRLTSAAGDTLTFAGPGAGPRATAVTILDDVVEALGVAAPGTLAPCTAAPGAHALDSVPGAGHELSSRAWFLTLDSGGQFSECDVVSILTSRQIPQARVVSIDGRTYVRTEAVPQAVVSEAASALRQAGPRVLALPVI